LLDKLVALSGFFLDEELFVVLQQLYTSLSESGAKLVKEVNLLASNAELSLSNNLFVLVDRDLYYDGLVLFRCGEVIPLLVSVSEAAESACFDSFGDLSFLSIDDSHVQIAFEDKIKRRRKHAQLVKYAAAGEFPELTTCQKLRSKLENLVVQKQ
jgi:hypothetical protein